MRSRGVRFGVRREQASRGVLPSNRLMGMCRWMGSHFYDWLDSSDCQGSLLLDYTVNVARADVFPVVVFFSFPAGETRAAKTGYSLRLTTMGLHFPKSY